MSKRRIKSLTVEEILAQLEEVVEDEDVESADAVIIPPEADALTDNEDIDDDCTGNVNIEDVAGSLELHVAAQISNEEVIDDTTGENAANHSEINFETKQAPNKKRKLCNSVPTWRCKTPEYTKVHDRSKAYENNLMNMKEQLNGSTHVEVFEKYFLKK